MVFEEPPAPAARVEVGLSLAAAACLSWLARRRIADLGPPGTGAED